MIHKFEPFEFFKVHKIPIDSALDIGAHKGTWTKGFKKKLSRCKSYDD
jgi:hypothetical protein